MFKFLNFFKPKPKLELGAMKKFEDSMRQKNRPEGMAGIYFDFIKEAFEEDAYNWTPEEREKRVDAYVDKVKRFLYAENEQTIKEITDTVMRQREEDIKIIMKVLDNPTDSFYPDSPLRPTKETQKDINETVDKMKFG